jgi:hypothetical protein
VASFDKGSAFIWIKRICNRSENHIASWGVSFEERVVSKNL